MNDTNIYDFTIAEETAYQTRGVPITDSWEWSMATHIRRSTNMKNSQLPDSITKLGDRPIKNIIRPILNVAYRSEGFDVKDIEPYVNDEDYYHLSLLVRKFHPKWARENDIDTFIDELVESYVDYGGALVKNVNEKRPEVVPLQRIAFCDQTDILSGAIGEKHMYSIDQLKDMEDQGWDKDKIEEVITMARAEKSVSQTQGQKAKTPGKYIEVYEVHGTFPETWYDETGDETNYIPQFHAIAYYKDQQEKKHGITLFKGKEKKPVYKFIARDKIYGRCLGFGGVEELFEPQTWATFSQIQIKEMLENASLMILQTSDPQFVNRNKITDIPKNQIMVHGDNQPLSQVPIQAINIQAFENSVVEWEQHARTVGSANDAQLGMNPSSGTPFALQQLIVSTGQGLHEFRKGKIATFVGEIYRDWVLQYLVNDMNKGQKWIGELSLDELKDLAEKASINHSNDRIKEMILSGMDATSDTQSLMMEITKKQFMDKGTKRFLEVLKGEFAKLPIEVEVNIAGKQKDLNKISDKLVNIIRQIIATPQILTIPGMDKIFNQLLEYSGFNPVDFSNLKPEQLAPPPSQPSPTAAPLPQLTA